jgi:hypothetical protein
MSKIDIIIDALSVAQNSVWSALNEQALAAARELQAEKQEPRKEWVGLTDDDWGQLWRDFEDACDELEVAYQEEAQKKYGEGHYYISSENQWEYDKRTIRDLVEAKLKEKNGG